MDNRFKTFLAVTLVLLIGGGVIGTVRLFGEEENLTPSRVAFSVQLKGATVHASVPYASSLSVADALAALDVPGGHPAAGVFPSPETPLTPGATIFVHTPVTLRVKDGAAEPFTISTTAPTIAHALAQEHIALSPLDHITPALHLPPREDALVTITRVTEQETEEIMPLPYATRTLKDPTLPWGSKATRQPGREGSAKERVRLRMENGEVVERTVLERTILEEPQPEIRVQGTNIVIGALQEGMASWYAFRGGNFAASTRFPYGTFLRVTNLENGKQVIVEVNDYGPTLPGRVIDLDAVAFSKLAPLWQGVIPVRVEEIK